MKTPLQVTLPTLWHWRAFLRHYVIKEILGEGQYGCVYLACRLHKSTVERPVADEMSELALPVPEKTIAVPEAMQKATKTNDLATVAVKSVMKRSDKANAKFLREICIHAFVTDFQQKSDTTQKPFVVPLIAVIFGWQNRLAAVMPVCTGGTLEEEMYRARNNLNRPEQIRLAQRRWAEGDRTLQWLHEHCMIIHGDAHAGNWYIDRKREGKLLLADFGESRLIQEIADTRQFLLLASKERLLFRFETAVDFGDKRHLGQKLSILDARLEKETDRDGRSLVCRRLSDSLESETFQ